VDIFFFRGFLCLASAGFLIFCSTTSGSCYTKCVTFRTEGKYILSL